MNPLTPARVARIFELATTVRRARKAKLWARAHGMPELGTALFFREMELWAGVAYPASEEHWRQRRVEALGRIDAGAP